MFLRSCLDVAEIFGSVEDVALLQSNIGCAIAVSKGSCLIEAMAWFKRALPVLRESNYHNHYTMLLIHMGWNMHSQGQIRKAEKYHKKAMNSLVTDSAITHDADWLRLHGTVMTSLMNNDLMDDSKHHVFVVCSSRSTVSLMSQKRFPEAREILHRTLEYAERFVPHHPHRAIMVNSLGLIEGEEKHDVNRAIQYYKASLTERRKAVFHDKSPLIVPLNNIGSSLLHLHRYDEALVYLNEARQICESCDYENMTSALTLIHIGRLQYHRGKYEDAIAELKEAERICKKCAPHHILLSKTRFTMGLCFTALKKPHRALAKFQDIIFLKDTNIASTKQHRLLIVEALQKAMSVCSPDEDNGCNVGADSSKMWHSYSRVLEEQLNELLTLYQDSSSDLSDKYRNMILELMSDRHQRMVKETLRVRHDLSEQLDALHANGACKR